MSMTFKPLCPHCQRRANVRSCKRSTSLFTELYCICHHCGAIWSGSVEVNHIINPPMKGADGQPFVKGAYAFDGEGGLVPTQEDAPPLRWSRGPSEAEKRQMSLVLPVD